ASRLAGAKTGTALVHISGQGVADVVFPLARRAFAQAPKCAAKKEEAHHHLLTKRPEYAPYQTILTQRAQLLEALLARLRQLPCAPEVLAGVPLAAKLLPYVP